MGVPKFFRWLSERYPKINQRYGALPNPETKARYFPDDVVEQSKEEDSSGGEQDNKVTTTTTGRGRPHMDRPDPLSQCGLPPEIDRLYLDMNGIIHGCSHNNSDNDEDTTTSTGSAHNTAGNANDNEFISSGSRKSSTKPKITKQEIFTNVCYYLDRVIGDIAKPNELVYMAIDGVAPRAKLNQQRSRRYRSGQEGNIEMNIYEAHAKAMKEQEQGDGDDEKEDWKGTVTGTVSEDEREEDPAFDTETGYSMEWSGKDDNETAHIAKRDDNTLKEVSPGRFKGKFETNIDQDQQRPQQNTATSRQVSDDKDNEEEETFHHNVITPGTEFFQEFTHHLEHFVQYKISTDPKWKDLKVIISGPNVPGEGEHKIMDFIREQKADTQNYNPNLRHCIMGQDGDLMMLGLATHEPNLVLLRERVLFNQTKERLNLAAAKNPLDLYIHNAHFEFLHMGVLRDYLAYEFNTSNINPDSPWDIERTIDDFVFMTFFVGNDFLPHMPALDIGDHAFDHLFFMYKGCRRKWRKSGKKHPYLTNAGEIVSGQRLEEFLSEVGSHENSYYDKKKAEERKEKQRLRKQYTKLGISDAAIPNDQLVASKEQADRDAYRRMLEKQLTTLHGGDDEKSPINGEFIPVVSSELDFDSDDSDDDDEENEDMQDDSFISRMGGILQSSFMSSLAVDDDSSEQAKALNINDQDLKGRYYYDKFQMTPFDAEKHVALRKAYVEGLVWTLKYYYQGCVSWEWYYPYHYGPMLSDLVNLDEILEDISFDENNMGKPLKPFEQLMGCMPPSQAHILPRPYRWLMTDPKSPIVDFYPKSFTVDMNGKRWPWEAVTLLPFIDSKRLLDAVSKIDASQLTTEELERNSFGETIVLEYDKDQSHSVAAIAGTEGFERIEQNKAKIVSYESSTWNKKLDEVPALKPELTPGVHVPLPGFSSLRDAPVHRLARKRIGLNVFGSRSRYQTACLEMSNIVPTSDMPPVETVAEDLIGKTVFVNYPHFLEALVIAVSSEDGKILGMNNELSQWSQDELFSWQALRNGTEKNMERGQGLTGSGGLIIPEGQRLTLTVRPVKGIVKTEDGSTAKTFADFSIEVPYISALWKPSKADHRFSELPPQLEADAYELAVPLHRAVISESGSLVKREKLFPARSIPSGSGESSAERGLANSKQSDSTFFEKSGSQMQQADKLNHISNTKEPLKTMSNVNPASGARKPLFPPRKSPEMEGPVGSISSFNTEEAHLQPVESVGFVGGMRKPLLPEKKSAKATDNAGDVTDSVGLVSGMRKSLLPDKKASISKRGFATFAPDFRRYLPHESSFASIGGANAANQGLLVKANHSRKPRALVKASSSPRGRILAAGVVGAGFLFGAANGAADSSLITGRNIPAPSFVRPKKSKFYVLDSVGKLRGGDVEYDDDTFPPSSASVPPLEFAHGTTTISFVFQGGIIAAVDSRASMGSFVGSKTVDKVLPVNSHILGTMAGGAADCMFWIRKLKSEALLHELTESSRMTVARASRLLSNALYQNRGLDLSVGTMIMGFDESGSSTIYYVDNTGVRIEGDQFAVGSGSTFALGILDTERRYDLSEEEAIALGIKAIRHATFRDAYSGGFINVFLITKDGWKKVFTEDLAR